MEADRLAVGGDIDKASPADARVRDFNHLHAASEELEEGVLVAGVAMVVFLSRPPVRVRARHRRQPRGGCLTKRRPYRMEGYFAVPAQG